MLRKAFHSACCLTYGFSVCEGNYHSELIALSVGRFAGSDARHVPERPTVFCGRRVPKRHNGDFTKNFVDRETPRVYNPASAKNPPAGAKSLTPESNEEAPHDRRGSQSHSLPS